MRDVIGRFESMTLAGHRVVVPDDLGGPTLLMFAYRQYQQRDVESWIRSIPRFDAVRVLEVPVLGRRWLPARWFINGGMASNMDLATREQTMCVYTDVAAFRRDVLGIASSEVLAVLVDARGGVRWHALGAASRTGARALRTAVAEGAGDQA